MFSFFSFFGHTVYRNSRLAAASLIADQQTPCARYLDALSLLVPSRQRHLLRLYQIAVDGRLDQRLLMRSDDQKMPGRAIHCQTRWADTIHFQLPENFTFRQLDQVCRQQLPRSACPGED